MRTNLDQMIDEVKAQGFQVRINHTRASRGDVEWALAQRRKGNKLCFPPTYPKYQLRAAGEEIDPRGGWTTVQIFDKDDQQVASGDSICSPLDQFRKHEGSTKALGRAIGELRAL